METIKYQKIDLLPYLEKQYGKGKVFTSATLKVKGISPSNKRQQLARLVKSGKLERVSQGVYLILDSKKELAEDFLLRQRYLKQGRRTSGYLSELVLLDGQVLKNNPRGLPTVVTNREKTNGRRILLGQQYYFLKRPYYRVTLRNRQMLQFFDFINKGDVVEIKKYYSQLVLYIQAHKYAFLSYQKVLTSYPSKTTKKLIETGLLLEIIKILMQDK